MNTKNTNPLCNPNVPQINLEESPKYTNGISGILQERGSRYGVFLGHAKITQDLKYIMHQSPNWPILSEDKKETLEMIAHKIGRILNGDPEYKDSWTDIIGYTKLVEDTLKD